LKVRKTLFFRLALYFPLVCCILPASIFFQWTTHKFDASILADSAISVWGRILLPVFGVMIALALYQDEHTLGMWKHLNALPTRGPSQILAKHAMLAINVVVATCWLGLFGIVGSCVLKLFRPHLTLSFDWSRLGAGLFLMLLEGLGATAMMAVIAARARTGFVGATLGLAALGCVFGNGVELRDRVPWGFGETWSRMISPPAEGGGPYSLTTCTVSTLLWLAATMVVHIVVEKRRPHY
jgi:hypothetical protein